MSLASAPSAHGTYLLVAAAVLALGSGACASFVVPSTDASAIEASVSFDAETVPDPSCRPLPRCTVRNLEPCEGECGLCIGLFAYAPSTETYAAGPRVCAPGADVRGHLMFRQLQTCREPEFALVAPVPIAALDFGSKCLSRATCIELERIARASAHPGDLYDQCWNTDRTHVTSLVLPAGICDATLRTCGRDCRCANGDLCVFRSETWGTGVCVSPVTPNGGPAACRAMPNPMFCQSGQACVLPLRGNNGMPDADRVGVCVDRTRCESIAALGGYRCDTTLAR